MTSRKKRQKIKLLPIYFMPFLFNQVEQDAKEIQDTLGWTRQKVWDRRNLNRKTSVEEIFPICRLLGLNDEEVIGIFVKYLVACSKRSI